MVLRTRLAPTRCLPSAPIEAADLGVAGCRRDRGPSSAARRERRLLRGVADRRGHRASGRSATSCHSPDERGMLSNICSRPARPSQPSEPDGEGSAIASDARSFSCLHTRRLDKLVDISRVNSYVTTHLQVGNAPLGNEPTNESLGGVEAKGDLLQREQDRRGCRSTPGIGLSHRGATNTCERARPRRLIGAVAALRGVTSCAGAGFMNARVQQRTCGDAAELRRDLLAAPRPPCSGSPPAARRE